MKLRKQTIAPLTNMLVKRLGVLRALLAIPLLILIACDRRTSVDKDLCKALTSGDTNYIQNFVASGSNVNVLVQPIADIKMSAPLLDIAIQYGQMEMVKYLLLKGANPNLPDSWDDTPLIWASTRVRNQVDHKVMLQMFAILLKAGANPNLKGAFGYTPLMWAGTHGQLEIAAALLNAGANVNSTNNAGESALHFAKNADTVLLLLGAGGDSRVRTKSGEMPVDYAMRDQRFDVVKVLTNAPLWTNHNDR